MKNKLFKKILIANRGEIAVRIIRACRELGIETVAIYSEVDRLALHVQMADEAYSVGPAPSRQSYLAQDKIIEVARASKAEAIHPGYGFLAENPEFARKVAEAGLVFIGPPPEAIRLMGDKTVARQRMLQAGVPVVPGTEKALDSVDQAEKVGKEIGLPILLKAAAGGGGKGMRIVKEMKELESSFRAAVSEAESAFGDGRVYLEKYLEAPRHIEFQILADTHGNVVHLGERECSIQRRHQKIIEEAPSCLLNEEMRQTMGEAAVKAAQACGYQNAGTVEFMVDKDRNFYFLEMNTRLQVEHPVTEMVTGLDLVKWQIQIAAGASLPFQQQEIKLQGHAIECRIYAEDPFNNFLPSIGKIAYMQEPSGPGVRVDSGLITGSEVTMYYDPIIAKLIVWGRTREEAIQRMKRALAEYQIVGVQTSIPFCSMVMNNKKFVAGEFDTHFVEQEFSGKMPRMVEGQDKKDADIVALAAALFEAQFKKSKVQSYQPEKDHVLNPWKLANRLKILREM